MKAILLFSGQGAQKIGMGKELAETFPEFSSFVERADSILDFSLSKVMWRGDEEELTRTSRCQPALYVMGYACAKVLEKELGRKIIFSGCAGLSLGEFTAHAIAGTFSFETGLELVARRGEFMEQSCGKTEGSMIAVIGGNKEKIQMLAQDCEVDIANYNAPGQIVLSGKKERIKTVAQKAKAYGAKFAKVLNVAGAYHSSLMAEAEKKLRRELEKQILNSPTLPVVSNYKGDFVSSPKEISETLQKQVTGSVRWVECMEALIQKGEFIFIECGPGGVLKGLMAKIHNKSSVFTFEKPEDLAKIS